jgi:site-specific DNA recombinase
MIPSYGYDRKKGEKIQTVELEEAEVVRRIFHMYLHDDYSHHQIARTLTAQNIGTKKGKKWRNKTVKLILTNPNYVGKVRYACNDADRYFEADGQHEQIIDEDTYYQVQEKLRKMQRVTQTKRPTSGVYFCGVIYCPACGGKYSSKWGYKTDEIGNKIPVNPGYRCVNSMENQGTCAARKYMSHAKLELAFEQYIGKIGDFTEMESDVSIAEPKIDHTAEINTITAELGQIQRKTEEIMGLFVSNNIDFDTYQGMVKISNQRRDELDVRLASLQNSEAAKTVRFDKREIVANFKASWQSLDNDQRLQFIQKFIKKIVVHTEPIPGSRRGNIVVDDILFNEF